MREIGVERGREVGREKEEKEKGGDVGRWRVEQTPTFFFFRQVVCW